MSPEISLVIAVISLIGTILVALFNVRSVQISASDKIASGSSQLIDEIQEARKRDKEEIEKMIKRIRVLEDWKEQTMEFLVEFWKGSKENEDFIYAMSRIPPYDVPEMPFDGEHYG